MLTMLDYIEQQPAILKNMTSAHFRDRVVDAVNKITDGKDRRNCKLVLIGSGTSYNAAVAASHSISVETEIHFPYHFTEYVSLEAYDDNALFVFISQGGKSLSTYRALEKVRAWQGTRFATLALVGEPDTPLALLADGQLPFGCGPEEVIYRTKGFTSSLLTLILLGEALAGPRHPSVAQEYAAACDLLGPWIEQSKHFFTTHRTELHDLSSLMFIGSGPNAIVALEGSLKAIETVRRPAMCFDLEEFIHGPQNAVEDSTALVIVENLQDNGDKAYILFKTLRQLGKRAYLIAARPPREFADFSLTRPVTAIDELTAVIPLQVLSYLTACDIGVDLTRRGFAELTQVIAKALP